MMDCLTSLSDAASHSTSAGFAVSYLGAAVRAVSPTSGGIVFNAGFGRRRITYLCATPAQFNRDIVTHRILSPTALPVNGNWACTKRREYVLRSLDTSHLSRKERYNECTHPIRSLERQGYRMRTMLVNDMPAVEKLWSIWSERKLADPRTHRISFTAARYLRCVKDACAHAYPAFVYVLVNGERIAAVRVLNTTQQRAFDLAFFSDYDVKESARALQWLSLQDLFATGIQEVNFGESTGKGLAHFKTRLQTEVITTYQYDNTQPEQPTLFAE